MLNLQDAAERLLTTSEAVSVELEAGRLKGFKIANEWRTTEEDVLEFMGHSVPANESEAPDEGEPDQSGSPDVQVDWREIEPFEFAWPRAAGVDPKATTEYHERAFAGVAQFRGQGIPIRIGFTERGAAGMVDRKRVNVFLKSNSTLVPLVQFVGANDYERTGRLASVIKTDEGPHLRPGDDVPPEYHDLPRCVYSEVVEGPRAARSVAVLAHKDDLTLMARHGLIRAKWKGLI